MLVLMLVIIHSHIEYIKRLDHIFSLMIAVVNAWMWMDELFE